MRFNRDDGWAIASHVAMSGLLAIFPFLIFVTALAAFLGAGQLTDQIVHLLFDAWPASVAAPLAKEIGNVLNEPRGGILTIGVLLTLWVSSSAVESIRIALGRAYHSPTSKPIWLSRLQSIWFVALGALGLVVVAIFIVLWPILWAYALDYVPPKYVPQLSAFQTMSDVIRYLLTIIVLSAGLTMAHLWLPGGRRRAVQVLPGVVFTVTLWIIGATGFSIYLGHFANYASTYAGLAGVMTAIIFLNVSAALFIFGAEFNAALAAHRGESMGHRSAPPNTLSSARAAPPPAARTASA